MEITRQIETDLVLFSIESGILRITWKEPVVIDLKMTEELYEIRTEICNGIAYPDLWDIRIIKYFTKESRAFAANPEHTKLVKAGAVIIKSKIHSIIGNYYLAFQNPPVPTKFFYTEIVAREWIEQFKVGG